MTVGSVPFIVSADTQSEQQIRAQIVELEAKLTQLKAQLVNSQQNTTSSCTAGITTTFRIGSQSRDVAVLQQFLISKGFLNSKATGYYGPVTAGALANFQASVGIRESGFGQITQAYVNRMLCSTVAQNTNTNPVITAFGVKDPNQNTRTVAMIWNASGATDAVLEMICTPGQISFITDKGNHPSCDKGGVWEWTGQTAGSVNVTPLSNSQAVTVPFKLTLLKNGVRTTQTQTINVTFPAPNTTPTASSFRMREIWTTGYSFKVGDTMGLNLSPAAIPVGYSLYVEAWDANDSTKVVDIKKIECTTGTECNEVVSWKIPDNLMKGDQQFVIRATLKKGDAVINTVRTGRIYVVGYDRYTSESLVPPTTLNATGANTAPAAVTTPDYSAPLPALTFSLTGDKIHFSQEEQITLNLKAYNNTDVPITLKFNSGCPRVIYTVGGYDRSAHVGAECTTNLGTSSVIKPKSSYTWQVIHSPSVYKIPVGSQKIEVSVNAVNKGEYPGVGWNVALPLTVYGTDNTSAVINVWQKVLQTFF